MQLSTFLTCAFCLFVLLILPEVAFAVATTYFTFRCCYRFWQWFHVLVVPLHIQKMAYEVIDAAENSEELDEGEIRTAVKAPFAAGKRARRTRYLPLLIRAMKSQEGLIKDNAANRMMLRKKIFNHATEWGIKPPHIQEFIDIAIVMVLTPSDKDIEAAQFSNTRAIKSRWDEFIAWGGRIASL